MSVWADFYPLVMTNVPSLTTSFADQHIRLAAADYFERTKSYIVDFTEQITVVNQSDYTLNLPANTDLVKLQEVYLNDVETDSNLNYERPTSRSGIYMLNPKQYRVYPTPLVAGSVKIRASVKPGALSVGIPDEYFSPNFEAISWGAVARLLALPKKPWSDMQSAAAYEAMFNKSVADVQAKTLKGYGKQRLRTTASNF